MSERIWLATTSCATPSSSAPLMTELVTAELATIASTSEAAIAAGFAPRQLAADARAQQIGRLEARHLELDRRAELAFAAEQRGAFGAAAEMRLEGWRLARTDLAVEIGMAELLCLFAIHGLLLLLFALPLSQQQRARTRQPRHDRADRDAHDLGDLAIGKLLQLAQHDDLAVLERKRGDELVQSLALTRLDQQRLGIPRQAVAAHQQRRVFALRRGGIVFEADRFLRPAVALHPSVTGAAHDAEQPGGGIVAGEGVEILERPEAGVLHHILRVGAAARHPIGKAVGGIQMRHDDLLEIMSFHRTIPSPS